MAGGADCIPTIAAVADEVPTLHLPFVTNDSKLLNALMDGVGDEKVRHIINQGLAVIHARTVVHQHNALDLAIIHHRLSLVHYFVALGLEYRRSADRVIGSCPLERLIESRDNAIPPSVECGGGCHCCHWCDMNDTIEYVQNNLE